MQRQADALCVGNDADDLRSARAEDRTSTLRNSLLRGTLNGHACQWSPGGTRAALVARSHLLGYEASSTAGSAVCAQKFLTNISLLSFGLLTEPHRCPGPHCLKGRDPPPHPR